MTDRELLQKFMAWLANQGFMICLYTLSAYSGDWKPIPAGVSNLLDRFFKEVKE